MSVNFDAPMTWKEFQNLSKEDQHGFLQHLIDEYGANAVSFAEMFHVSAQTVRKYIGSADIGITLNRGSRVDAKRWAEFLGEDAEPADTKPSPSGMQIRSLNMQFCGKIDVDLIAESLHRIFDGVEDGEIKIICTIPGTNVTE